MLSSKFINLNNMGITDLISIVCTYRSEHYCDPRIILHNKEEYDSVVSKIESIIDGYTITL